VTALQNPVSAAAAPARVAVQITINGEPREAFVAPHRSLLEVLREDLELTGTKRGCDAGDCGACSVILDGRLVASCLTLAVEADGATLRTIEGVALDDRPDAALHPVQQAFVRHAAVQCGFCTPGMVMATMSLLEESPHPTEDEVRQGIAGNLCRCTGYSQIVEAILDAADTAAATTPAVLQAPGGQR
jgi:carbon-monoxide dehydrogenase small subunit